MAETFAAGYTTRPMNRARTGLAAALAVLAMAAHAQEPELEIRSENFDGDETAFFDDVRLEYQPAWPATAVLTY